MLLGLARTPMDLVMTDIIVRIFFMHIFSVHGLSCEDCPDQCESTEYSAQVSYAKFRDPGYFFYKNLLRKQTDQKPAINKALFKEYETFVAFES